MEEDAWGLGRSTARPRWPGRFAATIAVTSSPPSPGDLRYRRVDNRILKDSKSPTFQGFTMMGTIEVHQLLRGRSYPSKSSGPFSCPRSLGVSEKTNSRNPPKSSSSGALSVRFRWRTTSKKGFFARFVVSYAFSSGAYRGFRTVSLGKK